VDAIEYNRQLDTWLAESGRIDASLFADLRDAYAYDAASTVGWVGAKLSVLQSRLVRGLTLSLYESAHSQGLTISSLEEYQDYVRRHFPGCLPVGTKAASP
jgi:hypothetical protein